jgi:succinoglycan biosynthesis transport protein ExoP
MNLMRTTGPQFVPVEQSEPRRLELRELFAIARRQKLIIIGIAAVVLAAALAYVVMTPRQFTAQATVLIDPKRLQVFRQDSLTVDPVFDTPVIESQLETLKSDNVIINVIKNLNLLQDPEFTGPGGNPVSAVIGAIRDLFSDGAPDTDQRKMLRAVGRFKDRMEAQRLGLSYALAIKFTSLSPRKSSEIANEIAEAFMLEQLESKFQVTQRAGSWLQGRIRELNEQATNAERRVLEFKAQNQIVDANGKMVNEQQLTELNTQLGISRTNTAEARARLDRIREVTGSAVPDASVTEALRSDVLTRLRSEYLDLVRREADWSARFGANHQQTIQLRADLRRLERVTSDELKRIEQSTQSDFEVARSREAQVQQSLADLLKNWGDTRQAQLTLKELESNATSFRSLHDTFVQRYLLAVQQQSFPISDARVISPAMAPNEPSAPRTMLILAGALIMGFGMGSSAALARELFDTRIRTAADLASVTNTECLGILPQERARPPRQLDDYKRQFGVSARLAAHAKPFNIVDARPEMWTVLRKPFSIFAETARAANVAIDVARMSRKCRTVAVVSAGAGEGKTVTVTNLALSIAQSGHRVLLIDGDLRKPQLTRSLTPDAQKGLLELLAGSAKLSDVIWQDEVTGMMVLPTVLSIKLKNTSQYLASEAMQRVLAEAEGIADYVLIDTPPTGPVADVRAFAHFIDSFIICANWSKTTRATVQRLSENDFLAGKLIGAVLTMVNVRAYRTHDAYDDSYYSDQA